MSEIQNSGVSQLQHLQSLQSQSKSKASNMIQLDDLVGVYLGQNQLIVFQIYSQVTYL